MTDPFDTPTGRWGLIFHGSGLCQPIHSRQEWAQIADAIRTADLLREGQPGVRGDDGWCSVATSTYRRLNDAGAYWHMRPGDQPRWHADQELIQAWLNAPVVVHAGEQPSTMLDAHGWQATFDTARAPDPADLSLLVDLAQTDGVVGAPRHKVSLLAWVDDGVFRDDAFLILLWPPNGPARGSSAVSRDALLPPSPSTVDRIVGLLASVASVANTLMRPTGATESRPDQTRAPTPPADGLAVIPNHSRGQPFRVLDGGNTAGSATSPPALRAVPSEQPPSRRPRI